MLTEPVHVAQTKIYVAPDQLNQTQFTVYANQVHADNPNTMMVLPVPYPHTVKFYDLTKHADMFEHLHNVHSPSLTLGTYGSARLYRSLKVMNVGSYQVTLVKSHKDLDKIDTNVFSKIPDDFKDMLLKYYEPYGFIVFKLCTGDVKYHPFAYSHKILTGSDGRPVMFVPTRHEHGNSKTSFLNSFNEKGSLGEGAEHWDHDIYSTGSNDLRAGTNTIVNSKDGKYVIEKLRQIDFFKQIKFNNIACRKIVGFHENEDIFLPVTA